MLGSSRRRAFLLGASGALLAGAIVVACVGDDPTIGAASGERGGPCNDGQCLGGLACLDGICVLVDAAGPTDARTTRDDAAADGLDDAGVATRTFVAVEDAMLSRVGDASAAQGTLPTMSVIYDDMRAVVRFDLSDIPSASTVETAALTFHTKAIDGCNAASTMRFGIHRLTEAWSENYVTWFQRSDGNTWTSHGGTAEDASVGTFSTPTLDVDIQLSIAPLVREWVAHPEANLGLLIRQAETPSRDGMCISSREDTHAPTLHVRYKPPR